MTLHGGTVVECKPGDQWPPVRFECTRCGGGWGPACGLDASLALNDCAHWNPGAAAFEPVREMAARVTARALGGFHLEPGRCYRRRDGAKVGPLKCSDELVTYRWLSVDPAQRHDAWDLTGVSALSDRRTDIVSLWIDDETLTTTFAPVEARALGGFHLEPGRCYRLRNGRKVGPVKCSDELLAFCWMSTQPNEMAYSWDAAGTCGLSVRDCDIVSLWIDDEILTTTFAPVEAVVGPRPAKAELLDAAKAAVADRGLNYGTPEDNFARIAALWRAHFQNRYGGEPKVDPHDVAQMMILMKVARLENEPGHLDSWTDVAGYAACGASLPISAR